MIFIPIAMMVDHILCTDIPILPKYLNYESGCAVQIVKHLEDWPIILVVQCNLKIKFHRG